MKFLEYASMNTFLEFVVFLIIHEIASPQQGIDRIRTVTIKF